MKCIGMVVFIAYASLPALAQVTQKFTISQLEFMAGRWQTASDWGDMQEIWSGPMGNSMMCTFRCVKDGKVVFYEFIVIEQNPADSVPVLKLRHFNPGSIGWEERTSPLLYPVSFLENQKVVFETPDKKSSISYERTAAKTLKSVLLREKAGKQETTEFYFSGSED